MSANPTTRALAVRQLTENVKRRVLVTRHRSSLRGPPQAGKAHMFQKYLAFALRLLARTLNLPSQMLAMASCHDQQCEDTSSSGHFLEASGLMPRKGDVIRHRSAAVAA
jgi:hypothetical protein